MGNYHSNRYRQSQHTSLEIFPLSSQSQLASVSVDGDKVWTISNTDNSKKEIATTVTNFQESESVEISNHNLFNFGNETDVVNFPIISQTSFNVTLMVVSEFDPPEIKLQSFLNTLKQAKRNQEILFFKKNLFLGVTHKEIPLSVQQDNGDVLTEQENIILIENKEGWSPYKRNSLLSDCYWYNVTAFNGIIANLSENTKNKGLTTVNIQINSSSFIIEDIQFSLSPLIEG